MTEPTTEAGRRLAGELQVEYRIALITAIEQEARADLAAAIEQRCGDILFGAVDDERFEMVMTAIREASER